MKFVSKVAAAAAFAVVAPGLAAADVARPYLSLGAGLNWTDDTDFTGGGTRTGADFNTGWGLIGAAGIGIIDSLRVEAELGYRRSNNDNLDRGDLSASTLMGNVLYDLSLGDIGKSWGIAPYIGFGFGAARINADRLGSLGANGFADDSSTELAYQGIVGFGIPINPSLTFTADYRYLSTFDDPTFSTSAGTRVEAEYASHMVMVGLRYTFGAPTPAPRPAPAPTPAAAPALAPAPAPAPAPQRQLVRSFLVFFDFDRSDITADARRVIEQAAANVRQAGGTTRITLTGHADRAGSTQYNQRLSQRRADAVRAELVRMGIAANDIATVARGESDPLVPTADGVREPRNRRVEIVF